MDAYLPEVMFMSVILRSVTELGVRCIEVPFTDLVKSSFIIILRSLPRFSEAFAFICF
jgi:hypothetical protein